MRSYLDLVFSLTVFVLLAQNLQSQQNFASTELMYSDCNMPFVFKCSDSLAIKVKIAFWFCFQ